MAIGSAVVLHPAVARRHERRGLARRAAALLGQMLLALAILAGGTVMVTLLLVLLVLASPLAAAILAWVIWRSGDTAARQARVVRSRLRRRARALGLVVLAGTQPGMLRLATAAVKEPSPPSGR